jgi:hypothetical protein
VAKAARVLQIRRIDSSDLVFIANVLLRIKVMNTL